MRTSPRRIAAAAALALLCAAPLAPALAQRVEPPRGPSPLVELYATGGLSLRQTLISTTFADATSGTLRLGVPLKYGIEPWVSAGLAHVKLDCAAGVVNCGRTDRRALLGASYKPTFGGRPSAAGPYVGVGFGVQSFRGTDYLAHAIVLGITLGSSALAPTVELRSESYQDLGELLMITAGLRLAILH